MRQFFDLGWQNRNGRQLSQRLHRLAGGVHDGGVVHPLRGKSQVERFDPSQSKAVPELALRRCVRLGSVSHVAGGTRLGASLAEIAAKPEQVGSLHFCPRK